MKRTLPHGLALCALLIVATHVAATRVLVTLAAALLFAAAMQAMDWPMPILFLRRRWMMPTRPWKECSSCRIRITTGQHQFNYWSAIWGIPDWVAS